jgi:hypothetical protein
MNVKSIAGQLGERRAYFALSSDSAHPLADHWSVSDFVTLTKPRVSDVRPLLRRSFARRRERARRLRIAKPATRTTMPKVSAEAASICSGFRCS